MDIKTGDVVSFDYTLWIGDEKKPRDTSLEAVAKKEGILHEGKNYAPLTITVGRQQIIPGLESRLSDVKKLGEAQTFDIPAVEAYGVRDAKKVQDVPMAQFRKQKVQPQVGMELNMQGGRGVVTRVAGGRVRVDMNHDLAGKDLRYEISVTKHVTDPVEKIGAVLGYLFPGGVEHTVDDEAITIELPDQAKFDQQWSQNKFRVLMELRGACDGSLDIKFVETFPSDDKLKAAAEAKEAADST